jgi:hypothetical protein
MSLIIPRSAPPPERRAEFLEKRREARDAAAFFARVCQEGRAELLDTTRQYIDDCGDDDAWRLAMAKVARLPRVSLEIQAAFIPIWVGSQSLPRRVGHRPTMAAALRVLMPGRYSGPPLVLYRAADTSERRRRTYGFSWTFEIDTARLFAGQIQPFQQGIGTFQCVIFKTLAPAEAVLLIQQREEYGEGEVVVDPYRLRKVEIVERRTIRVVPS